MGSDKNLHIKSNHIFETTVLSLTNYKTVHFKTITIIKLNFFTLQLSIIMDLNITIAWRFTLLNKPYTTLNIYHFVLIFLILTRMWLINFIFDSIFYFHQYSVRSGDKKCTKYDIQPQTTTMERAQMYLKFNKRVTLESSGFETAQYCFPEICFSCFT